MYSAAIITTLITLLDEKGEVAGEFEFTELTLFDRDPREDLRVKAQAEANMRSMFEQNKAERDEFKFPESSFGFGRALDSKRS